MSSRFSRSTSSLSLTSSTTTPDPNTSTGQNTQTSTSPNTNTEDPRFVATMREWAEINSKSKTEKVCDYCCLRKPLSEVKRQVVTDQRCKVGGGIFSYCCYTCNKVQSSDLVTCSISPCQETHPASECFPVVHYKELNLGKYGPYEKKIVKWACESCNRAHYDSFFKVLDY